MLLLRCVAPVLETNCYVIAAGDGGPAVVVDPGAGSAPLVRALLEAHDLTVGAVLLTHGHADHLWDAAVVAGEAPVHVGGPDLDRLEDPAGALGPALGEYFAALAGDWHRPVVVDDVPGRCLRDGGAQVVPGVVVRAVPAPGHTEGSTVYLVAGPVEATGVLPPGSHDLVALTGDVIFAGSVGRTDLPGGDEKEMAATLRTLSRALPPGTALLPGHGPGTVLGEELRTNPFLR